MERRRHRHDKVNIIALASRFGVWYMCILLQLALVEGIGGSIVVLFSTIIQLVGDVFIDAPEGVNRSKELERTFDITSFLCS